MAFPVKKKKKPASKKANPFAKGGKSKKMPMKNGKSC